MREDNSATVWTCDGVCDETVTLTGGYRSVPPTGWRLISIYPVQVNMALEPQQAPELIVFCPKCFGKFGKIVA